MSIFEERFKIKGYSNVLLWLLFCLKIKNRKVIDYEKLEKSSKEIYSSTINFLFGSSIVQYGIIWYLTLETGSAKILTLTTLCGFLPQMLISFFQEL